MLDKMTYNYIIWGSTGFYEIAYRDLFALPNILYLRHYSQTVNGLLARLLTRLTFSQKVNRITAYPFRSYTFPRLLSFSFPEDKPLCFIFFGINAFLFQSPYLSYLKHRYPQAKFVLYLQDIVARNKALDVISAKQQFHYIFSYDKGDCEKYGFIYHPTPYSAYLIPENRKIRESDLFFCGKGKDRCETIQTIYKSCTEKGLMCDFYIKDVPPAHTRIDGIHYNHSLSYIEYLMHVKKTKCILEIMQSGADGFTPRLWESIVFNKHLLSNNSELARSPFFRPRYVHLLQENYNPVNEWINEPVEAPSSEMMESISPRTLINHIEETLNS